MKKMIENAMLAIMTAVMTSAILYIALYLVATHARMTGHYPGC